MARFDMQGDVSATAGGDSQTDIYRIMGLMYATGRDCEQDLVAAHTWLNIAAIKGCERSVGLRAELTAVMSKRQLAEALRAARDWMTAH